MTMPWYEHIGCKAPKWEEEMVTIIVDYIMLVISSICLIVTIYGTYRYIKDHKKLESNSIKPTKPLYIGGLVFFIVSSFTLLNAFVYDALYLICPQLDDIEGPIYHAVYFLQIFCLWVILFLRVYSIFVTSTFKLSKWTINAYIIAFAAVLILTIPFYFIFKLNADSFITLPYVTLSFLFATALLVTFVHKLIQIFSVLGVDEYLMKTMVKNTILAVISIICTFLVIIILIVLYVRHDGDFHERYSILEELTLEFFILLDIVSNFVCVLLSYTFFDEKFQKLCGPVNTKIFRIISKKIEAKMPEIHSSRNRTVSIGTTTQRETTQTMPSSKNISSKEIVLDVSEKNKDERTQQEHNKEPSLSKSSSKRGVMLQLTNRLSKSKTKSKHNQDFTKPLKDNDANRDWDVVCARNDSNKPQLESQHSLPISSENHAAYPPVLRPIHSQPAPQTTQTLRNYQNEQEYNRDDLSIKL